MTHGKCISLYLIDGDVNGRIKCTLANWTGLVIKDSSNSFRLV